MIFSELPHAAYMANTTRVVYRYYSQQMAAAAAAGGATAVETGNVLDDFNSDLNLKIDADG